MFEKVLIMLLLCAAGLLGWQRPNPPFSDHPIKDLHQQLDYILLEINGDRSYVKSNGEVTVVAGDRIQVLEAVLVERTKVPQVVNLVGYYGNGGTSAEDRGVEVRTDTELAASWAETPSSSAETTEGLVFAVTASSQGRYHGAIYIRVLPPELKFVEAVVDGEKNILRDGSVLNLKKSNKLKIGQIKTNFNAREGLTFFFERMSPTKGVLKIQRHDLVFAMIHLVIGE